MIFERQFTPSDEQLYMHGHAMWVITPKPSNYCAFRGCTKTINEVCQSFVTKGHRVVLTSDRGLERWGLRAGAPWELTEQVLDIIYSCGWDVMVDPLADINTNRNVHV